MDSDGILQEEEAMDGDDRSTRSRILEAARQCFLEVGASKTSLNDVARVAGLSRGTVYRYFSDRQALIRQTVDRETRRFFVSAGELMRQKKTLTDQLEVFATVMAGQMQRNFVRTREGGSDFDLLQIFTDDFGRAQRSTITFLMPFVSEARARGELRSELDEISAAEWLARVLLSFNVLQSSVSFDLDNPEAVGRFVRTYATNGLAGPDTS
jgi:AcrR family transcriptional regulator